MRLHPTVLLLLAACSTRDSADEARPTDAVPAAVSAAKAPAAAREPELPDAADPQLFLNLDNLRWAEWEPHPPADRFGRLRELGIRPIRSDSFIEFDTASGYDPNGERAEAFHFADFSGDGVEDVIYNGAWLAWGTDGEVAAAEGEKLKIWQVIGGRAVLVLEHHGGIQRIWRRPGAPASFRTIHYGCCSDPEWTIEYFRPVQRGDTVRFQPWHRVMGRAEVQMPARFLAVPRRFTVNNDGYLLRASPRVESDSTKFADWYAWEGHGNALAEYGRGSRGIALAERTDSTGRVWWFVRMDGRTPPREAQIQEDSEHPVRTDRLGWMSSRFLTPEP
jgi:hypothetical protein